MNLAIRTEEFCNGHLAGTVVSLIELGHANTHGTHSVVITSADGMLRQVPIMSADKARIAYDRIVAELRATYA